MYAIRSYYDFSNQQIIILYIKNEVMKIDVAFNGKEALDKFGKAKYDLILMDVQMPIMDGFKATQKIRELEKSTGTHTPIIAVTANAFPEDKERCFVITSYSIHYTKLYESIHNWHLHIHKYQIILCLSKFI